MTDAYWHDKPVVALAGGVGGAKFAHGLAQVLPPEQLTVIVNTGDDFEHYDLHISPDLDTIMYTLAGIANPETGWGLAGETWHMVEMLQSYGETVWFNLGDRDLATHLIRTQQLNSGKTLTAVTRHLSQALGVTSTILPATDDPLATVVQTKTMGRLGFQEYFVRHRWQPEVTALEYTGQETARATSQVLDALHNAAAIFICPSNPLLSIAPLLAPAGIRAALEARRVPCIAISPLIGGKAVKGPTDKLMKEMKLDPSHTGIAKYYKSLIDGLVVASEDTLQIADLQAEHPDLAVLAAPTLMQTLDDRRMLATRVLNWMREVNW